MSKLLKCRFCGCRLGSACSSAGTMHASLHRGMPGCPSSPAQACQCLPAAHGLTLLHLLPPIRPTILLPPHQQSTPSCSVSRCCAALRCTMQRHAVQCRIVLCCAVPCRAVPVARFSQRATCRSCNPPSSCNRVFPFQIPTHRRAGHLLFAGQRSRGCAAQHGEALR